MQEPIVEAEDRHDALMALECRAQGRMVTNAQVATKPNDAGPASGHGWTVPARSALQAGNERDAVGGRVEYAGAEQLARPRGVPAPGAVEKR